MPIGVLSSYKVTSKVKKILKHPFKIKIFYSFDITNRYILYFCSVFFIVLDLRLSRLGLRR